MPLVKGKSKKSFEKNVKTEIESGKPLKQSLAIAYDIQRKAKKKAKKENPAENASTPAFREYAEKKMAEGGLTTMKRGTNTSEDPSSEEMTTIRRGKNTFEEPSEKINVRKKIKNPHYRPNSIIDTHQPEYIDEPGEQKYQNYAEGGEIEGRRMKRVSGSSFYYKPDDETLAKMREKKQDPNWHPPMKLEGEEEEMKYAHGGHVCSKCGHQDMEESDLESGSIAQKLIARKKFAKGGAVEDDVADLEANNTEGPGIDQSYNVKAKEYHKYDLNQLKEQPRDSNLKGRKLEESIAARVLRKLKKGA